MDEIRFEWNTKKDAANQKKHGVSFVEAQTVFYDENARLIHDQDHSTDEDRFLIMGISRNFRLLVVVHCYREAENIILIISARKASNNERKQYEEFLT